MYMEIVRVPPDDPIANAAIYSVLSRSHDKRIKQKNLDFYRETYKEFIEKDRGNVVFLVPLIDGDPRGLSVCQIRNDKNRNFKSFTVVEKSLRRRGIGKALLRRKLTILRKHYKNIMHLSFVNVSNKAGIALCNSSGLVVIGEGARKQKKGEKSKSKKSSFLIFSTVENEECAW